MRLHALPNGWVRRRQALIRLKAKGACLRRLLGRRSRLGRRGFIRKSASQASSAARRRARSDRSPSASACSRQAMRLTSHGLFWAGVNSPNTSAYLIRSSLTVIRFSAAASLAMFNCMVRSFLEVSETVNPCGH
jgi:hypothetical protein